MWLYAISRTSPSGVVALVEVLSDLGSHAALQWLLAPPTTNLDNGGRSCPRTLTYCHDDPESMRVNSELPSGALSLEVQTH